MYGFKQLQNHKKGEISQCEVCFESSKMIWQISIQFARGLFDGRCLPASQVKIAVVALVISLSHFKNYAKYFIRARSNEHSLH
jgi:hypothetical protein